jgi:hypothetical protein
MTKNAKSELTDFLVHRAFEPVLEARPDGRSEADKKKLKDVQDATRSEIERYRKYGSADEVVLNFERDLDSGPAKKVHAELKALHLPTLNDLRDQFERKAHDLGLKT